MKRTLAVAAVAMLMAVPALARQNGGTDGLPPVTPLGTIAPGQPSYVFGPSGKLVNRQDILDQQLATMPYGTAPRTGAYNDQAYGPAHPEANGLNTMRGSQRLVGGQL